THRARTSFFFQAEDGIRDFHVTGVQTCALPISGLLIPCPTAGANRRFLPAALSQTNPWNGPIPRSRRSSISASTHLWPAKPCCQIGRASCREGEQSRLGGGSFSGERGGPAGYNR